MAKNEHTAALEELFGEAREAARFATRVRIPLRKPEALRQLPLADTQFYLHRAPREQRDTTPKKPAWAILSFPAPHRMSVKVTTEGWWIDQAWTVEGVQATLNAGGWFLFQRSGSTPHEFASREARAAAKAGLAEPAQPKPAPFGDEILQEFWAAQAALLPSMK